MTYIRMSIIDFGSLEDSFPKQETKTTTRKRLGRFADENELFI